MDNLELEKMDILNPLTDKPRKLDVSVRTYTHQEVLALLKKQKEICAEQPVKLTLPRGIIVVRQFVGEEKDAILSAPLATEVGE